MKHYVRTFLGAIIGAACVSESAGLTEPPKSRTFEFTYEGTVTSLQPGQLVRIWLPVPPSNEEQEVVLLRQLPGEGKVDREPEYGNQVLYFEAKADQNGKAPFSVTYRVRRKEVRAEAASQGPAADNGERFLKPDAKVPVGGKCMVLLKGKTIPADQVAAGRLIYDVVNSHMRYSKEGTGWGRGDAEWACDSRFGNCSDFHSLFISLARAQKMPAKFEMGFPLPEKRGAGDIAGYHCWAKFKPENKNWMPVDISEANKNPAMRDYYFGNLTPDRVMVSVGRDLELVPKQDGPRLNFFVYPYVEVDKKPYPESKIERRFRYNDIEN
jgi:transglutaminase-like putative cysteine protease